MSHETINFLVEPDGHDGNDPDRNLPPGASRDRSKCSHPNYDPNIDGDTCRWCGHYFSTRNVI